MDRKNKPARLHILLDSREQSISFAKQYYAQRDKPPLGNVLHIRPIDFAEHFKAILRQAKATDRVLVSLNFVSEDQLKQASAWLATFHRTLPGVTFAAFACFAHIKNWCDAHGLHFEENFYKQRLLPPQVEERIRRNCFQEAIPLKAGDQACLDRIWVQYRLMTAIIERCNLLGAVARQLIEGQPEENSSLPAEYNRALRYYKLGELDMAGGTYSCEKNSNNPIDQLRNRINLIAVTDYNVLIHGESGSGKETVAWAIHELSARKDKPFLTINCAGLSDELLESDMFGYVKGSHNQACDNHPGLLETAKGGTVFLDELPEMGARVQAKFLRVLETGEYRPLGGTENKYTDVRIIAAGQTQLLSDPRIVRRDLLSRISQLAIEILPLREMERSAPGTLGKIAYILLERYTWTMIFRNGARYELTPQDIKEHQDNLINSPEILLKLSGCAWRESNIRQLNNFLRHWLVFGEDAFVDFPLRENDSQPPADAIPISAFADEIEINDEQLKLYLQKLKTRADLATLFQTNPLHGLKRAYVRHVALGYQKIVAYENSVHGTEGKPTQKELASLMGITEYTLSRYKN